MGNRPLSLNTFRTLIVTFSLTSIGCSGTDEPKTTSRSGFAGTPDTEITAEEVGEAFEGDPGLYTGKSLRIAGYVTSLERRSDGALAIVVKTSGTSVRAARCQVNAEDVSEVPDLEPGTPVSVAGRIAGFSESAGELSLENCRTL